MSSSKLNRTEPRLSAFVDQGPIRILIVEDERIIAYDLKLRLQSLGYEVVDVVSTGQDAIRVAATVPLDLILMDIVIDGDIDGIETAIIIRKSQETPVVFLTAFSDESTFERARQIDQFAYLLKPFQERELNFTIKTVLQSSLLERKLKQSEQQYRSLFEYTTEPIVIIDNDGNLQDLNQAARKVLGEVNAQKKSIFNLFPASGQSYIRRKWDQMLSTGSSKGRFRFRFQKQAHVQYFEISLQANLYPGLHMMMLFNSTSRVESDNKIKELARTSSDSPHPIIRLGLKGQIIYFNKAALPFIFHWEQTFPETSIPPKLRDLITGSKPDTPLRKLNYRLKNKVYSVRLVFVPDSGFVNLYATDITDVQRGKTLLAMQRDALEQIARGKPIVSLAKSLGQSILKVAINGKLAFFSVNQVGYSLTPFGSYEPEHDDLLQQVLNKIADTEVLVNHLRDQGQPLLIDDEGKISLLTQVKLTNRANTTGDGIAVCPIHDSSGQLVLMLVVKSGNLLKRDATLVSLIRLVTNMMAVAIERDRTIRTISTQALLLGNINDAVVTLDGEGLIVDWNLSSHKLFGYSRQEALGHTLESLGILPFGPKTTELISSTAPIFLETEFKGQHEARGFAELSLVPMADSTHESVGCMCLFRDITIRRKYEDQIRTSEANLTSLIENTDDIICSVNIRGQLLTTNSAFQNFVNQLSGERDLTTESFLSLLPPRVAAEIDVFVRRAIEGAKLLHEFEVQLNDQSAIVLETSFNPMRDERGKIEGVSIFARNITQRKHSEDELKRTNFELDSFVYRASHDLRAPLRSILGLLNLMEIDPEAKAQDQYRGLVRTSINKLDTFIADLTHYSRNSRTEVNADRVDFLQIIDDCLDNLKFMEHAGRIKIYTDIYGNSSFFSDAGRLTVVFQNLISNAIKYQDLEKYDPFLKIRVSSGVKNAQILIEDNGKGIKQDYLNRIFDMFFRASEDSYGSGLGLYITKQVIEKLGGTIVVNSEFGKGTTFAITIPNLNKEFTEAGPDIREHQLFVA